MQHAVVGAHIDNVIDKYGRGVHNISQHVASIAVAVRVFAPDKFDNPLCLRAQFAFLVAG